VLHVGLHGEERGVVGLAAGELEELRGILQLGVDLLDRAERFLEGAAFLSELLCALRIGPDAGIFERAGDFD